MIYGTRTTQTKVIRLLKKEGLSMTQAWKSISAFTTLVTNYCEVTYV